MGKRLSYQYLDQTFYIKADVPSTRFPTPIKGAGATDHSSDSSHVMTIAMIVATIVLCILALTVEGVMPMIAGIAVNLASHFAIVAGSRVEDIAVPAAYPILSLSGRGVSGGFC
jgi:hypothetical protein